MVSGSYGRDGGRSVWVVHEATDRPGCGALGGRCPVASPVHVLADGSGCPDPRHGSDSVLSGSGAGPVGRSEPLGASPVTVAPVTVAGPVAGPVAPLAGDGDGGGSYDDVIGDYFR
jgi:hypothetical protein